MKNYLLAFVMGLMCLVARAVPADPTPGQVTQPDGTKLTVVLHGDEFFNYLTTEDGYSIVSQTIITQNNQMSVVVPRMSAAVYVCETG